MVVLITTLIEWLRGLSPIEVVAMMQALAFVGLVALLVLSALGRLGFRF